LSESLIKLSFSLNWRDDLLINIVIPTYNRKENLLFLLNHLSNLDNSQIGIIVLDNNSDNFITEFDICTLKNRDVRIKLYRNALHLGPDANILRAIELANSAWIYLLGDSRIPNLESLNQFVFNSKSYIDYSAIVYSFDFKFNSDIAVNSLNQYFNLKAKFGDILLVGNVIINKKAVYKFYSIATQFTLSRSVLPVFIILSLNDKQNVLFKNQVLISYTLNKPIYYDPKLSLLECWAQFSLLINLPINFKYLPELNKHIIENENFQNRKILFKFCLIKIFRDRLDISQNLKFILNYRYVYHNNLLEMIMIYFLYFLSFSVKPFFGLLKHTSINNKNDDK